MTPDVKLGHRPVEVGRCDPRSDLYGMAESQLGRSQRNRALEQGYESFASPLDDLSSTWSCPSISRRSKKALVDGKRSINVSDEGHPQPLAWTFSTPRSLLIPARSAVG